MNTNSNLSHSDKGSYQFSGKLECVIEQRYLLFVDVF